MNRILIAGALFALALTLAPSLEAG